MNDNQLNSMDVPITRTLELIDIHIEKFEKCIEIMKRSRAEMVAVMESAPKKSLTKPAEPLPVPTRPQPYPPTGPTPVVKTPAPAPTPTPHQVEHEGPRIYRNVWQVISNYLAQNPKKTIKEISKACSVTPSQVAKNIEVHTKEVGVELRGGISGDTVYLLLSPPPPPVLEPK